MDPSPLSKETLQKFRSAFYDSPKNILAQNVCSRVDPFDVCLSRKQLEDVQHVFNHKVDEGKPMTNQKSSGRCWIFATLNVIRLPFMKQLNIEDFEFSQGYLFFWDKIERCHFFLNNVVEVTKRNEAVDGRLMSFLLHDPTTDGGQWDMIVNVINKHGLMPKKCFPESFSCEASLKMNRILKSKLCEYAKAIRDLLAKGAGDSEVRLLIEYQMENIFRIVGICLGIPSETFTWNYYDKNKGYHTIGPISPKDFYENHVKPIYNVDDKVCLVTDPRPTNPFGKSYTVDCLGNVVGGRACIYNNQPANVLLDLVKASIKDGEAVWFGCEVSKRFAPKQGIQDLEIHDFPLVFGVDIQTTLTKAERLLYGESAMTHAMVFTAVNTNDENEVTKLRIENSWGEERGEKGYLIMTVPWFNEFVFEVVVDKKYVPEDVMDVFKQEPVVLPAWDPMGTLAQ
ncbi:PREDICTED: bleomycin hydrolase [Nicrophorus vespilloides]|uniref:Bleomycin hydrolase n=1 Tax=Nicrophorus vespilloides TaxID=110193 RepID=A0ABM1M7Z4_NICVS|nr:PREDICTED: bleomycin hydrolase [Nicrophorus vespilloides]